MFVDIDEWIDAWARAEAETVRTLPCVDDILHEHDFDWERGIFSRKGSPGISGYVDASGYRRVRVNGFNFAAHRLVWKLHNDREPNGLIDHVNGIRDDNRIENLRQVTQAENARNRDPARWKAELARRRLASVANG